MRRARSPGERRPLMANSVQTKDLATLMQTRSVIVAEILPPSYYAKGHLPGAINLPLEGFDGRVRELIPNPESDLVVYCASATCNNSEIAARRLKDLGYTRVRVYAAGKAEWASGGYPLEAA
jgi:rhodanese-related sulfurtransferase